MQFQKKEKRQTTVRFDSHHVRLTWSTDLLTGSSLWLIIIKATPRKRSVQT